MRTDQAFLADDPPVMTVTSLIVRGRQGADVADAFDEALGRAGGEDHHLATVLLQQTDGLSFLISLFRSRADLDAWMASAGQRRMAGRFDQHAHRELCVFAEPVTRVIVPSDQSGPRWKVFLVTWAAVLPIVLLVNAVFAAVLPGTPLPLRLAITSFLLSASVIWFISPVTRQATRLWRLRDQQLRVTLAPISDRPNASPPTPRQETAS